MGLFRLVVSTHRIDPTRFEGSDMGNTCTRMEDPPHKAPREKRRKGRRRSESRQRKHSKVKDDPAATPVAPKDTPETSSKGDSLQHMQTQPPPAAANHEEEEQPPAQEVVKEEDLSSISSSSDDEDDEKEEHETPLEHPSLSGIPVTERSLRAVSAQVSRQISSSNIISWIGEVEAATHVSQSSLRRSIRQQSHSSTSSQPHEIEPAPAAPALNPLTIDLGQGPGGKAKPVDKPTQSSDSKPQTDVKKPVVETSDLIGVQDSMGKSDDSRRSSSKDSEWMYNLDELSKEHAAREAIKHRHHHHHHHPLHHAHQKRVSIDGLVKRPSLEGPSNSHHHYQSVGPSANALPPAPRKE